MRRSSGFSLMEMMVVLLIVAIISAAAAPMVSKKLASGAGGSGVDHGCGWKGWDGNTVFNSKADDGHSVLIGVPKLETKKDTPHLFISTKSHKNPQIRLQDKNKKEHINLAFFNRSIWLSSRDVPNTTEYATAVGYEASAYNNATALGYKANALGVNSVAIGREVTAFSDSVMIGNSGVGNKDFDSINLIAIGSGAQNISKSDAIMIGTASNSNKYLKAGQGAVAIGSQMSIDKDVLEGARAGFASVAIGTGSNASTNSVAIGLDAKTEYGNNPIYHSIAIGPSSEVQSNLGTALGYQAKVKSINATALGASADVSTFADNAVALGYKATIGSFAKNATALGTGAVASNFSNNAVAIGYKATADKADSIAIGYNSKASNNAICIGYNAHSESNVTSTNSIAIGVNTIADTDSIAIGTYDNTWTKTSANATGSHSIAIGHAVEASGASSIAIGTGSALELTVASGHNTIAIGSAKATANNSIALMHNAEATGENSIAIGRLAKANNNYSTAIGYNAQTTASNQIVLGDEDTVVYIPGNLVVGNTVAAKDSYVENSLIVTGIGKSYFRRESNDKFRLPELKAGSENTWAEYTVKDWSSPTLWRTYYPNDFSDRRLKNVGEVFKGGLDEIKKLEVFNYTYKKDKDKTQRVGVMAQDLQKIFPNAVVKGDDGFLRIRMEDMFYALVNAVKELDKRIDILAEKQKEIDVLKAEVKSLKKDYADLEKRLAKLEKQK